MASSYKNRERAIVEELKQDDQLTVCQLFVNLQRTEHSRRDLQDERNVLYACIIMPPMATDNETDESIRLLASVSIATSGQTNQFLQYKQWFGNVKKMVTTQPSAPRMQSNSERMAGCVVAVNHNHLKHMIARSLEFGVHIQ